jgi:CTP:molybdopterin cytidylyltransferase MocA
MDKPVRGRIIDVNREIELFTVWFDDPDLVADYDIALLPDGCAVNDIVRLGADGRPVALDRGVWTEVELAAAREGARQLLNAFGWP